MKANNLVNFRPLFGLFPKKSRRSSTHTFFQPGSSDLASEFKTTFFYSPAIMECRLCLSAQAVSSASRESLPHSIMLATNMAVYFMLKIFLQHFSELAKNKILSIRSRSKCTDMYMNGEKNISNISGKILITLPCAFKTSSLGDIM
jgi:hypothetical protein